MQNSQMYGIMTIHAASGSCLNACKYPMESLAFCTVDVCDLPNGISVPGKTEVVVMMEFYAK